MLCVTVHVDIAKRWCLSKLGQCHQVNIVRLCETVPARRWCLLKPGQLSADCCVFLCDSACTCGKKLIVVCVWQCLHIWQECGAGQVFAGSGLRGHKLSGQRWTHRSVTLSCSPVCQLLYAHLSFFTCLSVTICLPFFSPVCLSLHAHLSFHLSAYHYMPTFLFTCLPITICPPFFSPVCLSLYAHLSFHLSLSLCTHLSFHLCQSLHAHLSFYLSLPLCAHLSFYLSVSYCMPNFLFTCLFVAVCLSFFSPAH